MDLDEFLTDVGTLATCNRCGALCRVGVPEHPDARLMRKSRVANGLCVNCAMTFWMLNIEPLTSILAAKGPQGLLVPAIQEQAARVLLRGKADAKPEEIDWRRIVDQWPLPWPDEPQKKPKRARR